jgi:hypothetical protein
MSRLSTTFNNSYSLRLDTPLTMIRFMLLRLEFLLPTSIYHDPIGTLMYQQLKLLRP